MVYNDRTGQGKLPQELVTDNALLRRKYESEELEGAWPVLSTPSDQGTASKTVVLTQAQYDALTVKDPTTLYLIVG